MFLFILLDLFFIFIFSINNQDFLWEWEKLGEFCVELYKFIVNIFVQLIVGGGLWLHCTV